MSGDALFDTNTLIYAISGEGERRSVAEELLLKGGTITSRFSMSLPRWRAGS